MWTLNTLRGIQYSDIPFNELHTENLSKSCCIGQCKFSLMDNWINKLF